MHPIDHVHEALATAGWRGTRTAIPTDAIAICEQFGGLTVGFDKPGLECACSSVLFERAPLRLNDMRNWEQLLRTKLFMLATCSNGAESLFLSSDGRVFGRSEMHDAFYFYDEGFVQALERILLGKRAKPLLRPDQTEVHLYGMSYTKVHPDVYVYASPA